MLVIVERKYRLTVHGTTSIEYLEDKIDDAIHDVGIIYVFKRSSSEIIEINGKNVVDHKRIYEFTCTDIEFGGFMNKMASVAWKFPMRITQI